MLGFIKANITADLVIWTGDNSIHDVFNKDDVNATSVAGWMSSVTESIKKNFDQIEFYPSMGNHDVYPNNVEEFSDV